MAYAHRISWELHFGPVPEGLHVLHHCDVPRCVRPDHLFIGTRSDNMADMQAKGRGNRSDPKLVDEVMGLRSAGRTQQSIADQLGISQSLVSLIVLGQHWTSALP